MKTYLLFLLLIAQLAAAQDSFKPQTRAEVVRDLLGNDHNISERTVYQQSDDNTGRDKKSAALAAVYSLLLPGMGELYVGNYGSGKYFTIAEGALWLGWGGMQWYGSWLQNDARQFAVQYAEVSQEGKSDQYYIDIGNFKDVYIYNEQVLRGRDVFKTYDPNSPYYWQWDTDVHREEYRQLRVSSDEIFNNSRFLIAVIGINHLISAINAGRLAIFHNSSIDEASTIDIHANIIGTATQPQGIMISFSKSF